MLFTGEYPGVDPHEGIPMRGDVSGDIWKEAVGKRHLGRGICGETSGTTVVKLGMPWSHIGSPDHATHCFLTKEPHINLPMWVLGRTGGPCAMDATRDLIIFKKTSKNLLKWSWNSGEKATTICSRVSRPKTLPKNIENISKKLSKVREASTKIKKFPTQLHKNFWNGAETLNNWWPPISPEFSNPKSIQEVFKTNPKTRNASKQLPTKINKLAQTSEM